MRTTAIEPVRRTQPAWIDPMLATLTDQREVLRQGRTWIVERKLDGFRAIAYRQGASVRLMSRNRKDLGTKYPEIVEALRGQPLRDFIIDGEIVAFRGRRVSFQALQQRLKAVSLEQALRSGVAVFYYVFDLLHANGFDARPLPLRQRKTLLKKALVFNHLIRSNPARAATPGALDEACRRGWEGLIAKVADGPYISGRNKNWLKLKCDLRQEFVIGGYTDPQGSRVGFGALLIGYYEKGVFRYAGKVGTGYDTNTLNALTSQLRKIETGKCPFASDPELPRRAVHWVKPQLIAEVGFSEWTGDGKLRHPRFLGLRDDKSPREIGRERPQRAD